MEQIEKKLKEAIGILFKYDDWLLTQDLNEQSIAHKFAEYLQQLSPDYSVDCEYNGDITKGNGRKRINVLKEELEKLDLLKDWEKEEIETELATRSVFPDIIVHRRKTNEFNFCIIEIRKSTSQISTAYMN